MRFLDNISELISSKVYEEFKVKNEGEFLLILDNFIKNVDAGVVILTDGNRIYDLNEMAMKQLALLDEKSFFSQQELIKNSYFDTNKYKNKGTEVYINIGKYKSIFIFDNKKEKTHEKSKIDEKKGLFGVDRIVGNSQSMKKIKGKVQKIADSISTVLITGESGTGKRY